MEPVTFFNQEEAPICLTVNAKTPHQRSQRLIWLSFSDEALL